MIPITSQRKILGQSPEEGVSVLTELGGYKVAPGITVPTPPHTHTPCKLSDKGSKLFFGGCGGFNTWSRLTKLLAIGSWAPSQPLSPLCRSWTGTESYKLLITWLVFLATSPHPSVGSKSRLINITKDTCITLNSGNSKDFGNSELVNCGWRPNSLQITTSKVCNKSVLHYIYILVYVYFIPFFSPARSTTDLVISKF